jgi:anti-anti-sigma factor
MHSLLVYASPRREQLAVASWIAQALGRGEKVLYKHAPTEDAARVLGRSLPQVGLGPGVLSSGRVELIDTAVLRAESGGEHERLYELHLEHARQAAREGFTGLALTGNAGAMRTITADETELSGYERDLDRLAHESDVPSLCRYPVEERPELLGDMFEVHFRDVDDEHWAAAVTGDRLRVRGEIDFSNADRLAAVLRAMIARGLHTVDLSGVEFCAVAGIRALLAAADPRHGRAARLTLEGVPSGLLRLLTLTGATSAPGLHVTERETEV